MKKTMTELFDNKYKTHSLRLPKWDYSKPGSYFITICTQDRISYFGEVINGEMRLNDIGNIVWNIRQEIPYHFPHVELETCMIMPNHIHLIITINEILSVETSIHGVSPCNGHAINRISTNTKGGFAGNKNPMNNDKSISHIIRRLKGKTTFMIKKYIPTFKRQANYYEHVIRNERDFERIHTYISNNPLKRGNDEYYK